MRSAPAARLLLTATVALTLPACGDAPTHSQPDLLALGNELYAGDSEFFGHAPLLQAEQGLRQLRSDDIVARKPLEEQRFDWNLRLGNLDAANSGMAWLLATALARHDSDDELARLHYWRGLAFLRQAETENCVGRHNSECCIWPLQGGGVHTRPQPALSAIDAYLDYLKLRPENVGVQWLLNVAAMAAGVHPDGVPERYRLQLPQPDPRSPVGRFKDRATELGLDALDLCGGAVVQDLDGDGLLDIVSSTSDPLGPMHIYLHRADGSFDERSDSAGLTAQVGAFNVIANDYDNDGDLDLLVLRGAWLFDQGRLRKSLLRNDGLGNFTDVTTQAGLKLPARPSQTAAFADFDNDGDLDVYVGCESRREIDKEHPGGDYPSQLFLNRGDGTFVDIAEQASVTNDRYAKGVAVGDYDNDGDLDLYVSNFSAPGVHGNRLYRNDGDLHFTDVAQELGVADPAGRSFACWFFDYDNDGWLDLFVASFQADLNEVAGDLMRHYCGNDVATGGGTPRLYHNLHGRFEDVTLAMGLDRVALPMGANFGDVDNDGFLDIYLATGEPAYEMLSPNLLLQNDGGKRFVDVTIEANLGHLQKGHGVAFADLDQDGDQDLFHQLGGFYLGDRYANALFENPGTKGQHFLTLELTATKSPPNGFGARVEVVVQTPSGQRSIHRAPGCVSSFGGSPFRQEIGLGEATAIVKVVVTWPRSAAQEFTEVPIDAFVGVTEGQKEARRLVRPRVPFAAKKQ